MSKEIASNNNKKMKSRKSESHLFKKSWEIC